MALITILDAHCHARTGVVHDWHAIYLVQPDGASVSATVHIPGRDRPFKLQTYLTFDPGNRARERIREAPDRRHRSRHGRAGVGG